MIHTFEAPSPRRLKQGDQLYKAIKSLYKQSYSKVPHVMHIGVKCDCRSKTKASKKPEILSHTSNYIDPAPDLSIQEEVIARQLALIGDQMVTKQQALQEKNSNRMAASLVVVGVAGVAVLLWAKKSE